MSNPLLDFSGLPRFAEISNEHITPAIETLLKENRAVIDKVRADDRAPSWRTFVQPMTDANERLSRAWGQVSHLNAVMNTPQLREIYNANLPVITQFYAELSQDVRLFEKFKQLRASAEFDQLTPARKRIIDNELRDFRLGGAELPAEKKQRFLQIQEELSKLTSTFSDNLLDATNAYSLLIEDAEKVAGIPDDVLQSAQHSATADGKTGWKFTLHMPSYLPVLQYADNRDLREQMYRAYATRASEFDSQGDSSKDNMPLINKILELRREAAHMLGYDNYAEVSLATKMATSPQQVLDFLKKLAAKAKPYAVGDLQALQQFAAEKLTLTKLEAWDLAYVSEKLRQERYAFSDQEVKQYFPEDKVLAGMFKVVEKLYGIRITLAAPERKIQCWHPDVKFFDIHDANGQLIGQFYLDLYARPTKRGGAWMDDAITRRRIDHQHTGKSTIQLPVAYLTCNFSAPVTMDDQLRPALFTHNEVIVLFHEFGHGLHHLMTKVEDLGVSGINGVEWDAVELPSQFMENFCWEWDVLTGMTQHIETGESLPKALFDKMIKAKNFQSGLQMLRQIEFALFDMHVHFDFKPDGDRTVLQLLDDIRKQVAVIIPPDFNRFPNSFAHIFAGGYAAGYYS
ncbi:MAG: M3 family metallopeptidase, partial [Nitrosomonas sp.]|nr:M3 family metallopeptidase [Nitrosomonas sp.]